jgi:hypothetical protein
MINVIYLLGGIEGAKREGEPQRRQRRRKKKERRREKLKPTKT